MDRDMKRADLGFAADLEEFDPAEWQAGGSGAAEAAGFRSREVPPPARRQRRRRTGRNTQLNLKLRPETVEAFCAIADRQGWGLGETLEQAVVLLERSFPKR